MPGLWIFLAMIVIFAVIALLIGRRQRQHPSIDWSTEPGAPDHSAAARSVSQMGAAFSHSTGSPEDNLGLRPENLKRKK